MLLHSDFVAAGSTDLASGFKATKHFLGPLEVEESCGSWSWRWYRGKYQCLRGATSARGDVRVGWVGGEAGSV